MMNLVRPCLVPILIAAGQHAEQRAVVLVVQGSYQPVDLEAAETTGPDLPTVLATMEGEEEAKP